MIRESACWLKEGNEARKNNDKINLLRGKTFVNENGINDKNRFVKIIMISYANRIDR